MGIDALILHYLIGRFIYNIESVLLIKYFHILFRFSKFCYLDTDNKSTCSRCKEGYIGRNCEM